MRRSAGIAGRQEELFLILEMPDHIAHQGIDGRTHFVAGSPG